MRVTLIILTNMGEEIARVIFPTKEAFMAAKWIVTLPNSYSVEWEDPEPTGIPEDYAESAE